MSAVTRNSRDTTAHAADLTSIQPETETTLLFTESILIKNCPMSVSPVLVIIAIIVATISPAAKNTVNHLMQAFADERFTGGYPILPLPKIPLAITKR